MANSAVLAIKILADDQASAKFGKAGDATSKWGDRAKKAGAVAAGVLGGMVAFGKAAFDSASNLQQQAGAVESVFGKNAGTVNKFAKNASSSVGLAASDYSELAALLGSQLGNMGVSQDKLAKTTDGLIHTGADLAAQFGGSSKDAVSALSSALKGEMDPLEKYGINLSQTKIQAELAARGQDKLTGKSLTAAKTAATLALVQKESAKAHGAFARESDTAAGAQARAAASMENAKAALGSALLPLVAKGATLFATLAKWVQKNAGVIQKIAPIVAGLAGAIVLVVGATRVYTAVQAALNVVMSANPVALIVLAIVALVAIVVLAYKKSETFRKIVQAVGKAGAAAFRFLVNAAKAYLSFYVRLIKLVVGGAVAMAKAIRDKIRAALDFIRNKIASIRNTITSWRNSVSSAASSMGNAIRNKIRAALDFIRNRIASIRNTITGWRNSVSSAASSMANAIRNRIRAGIDAVASRIRSIVSTVAGWRNSVSSAASSMANAIRDKIRAGIDAVRDKITTMRDRFVSAKDSVVTAAGRIGDKIRSAIRDPFDAVLGKVQAVVDWIGRIHFPSPPGWLDKILHRSANIAAPANPAGLSAGLTRGGYGAALHTGGGGVAVSAGGPAPTYVFNIRVEALDPVRAAKAVTRAIDYSDTLRGKPVSLRRPAYAR